jgi:hypothetical protein
MRDVIAKGRDRGEILSNEAVIRARSTLGRLQKYGPKAERRPTCRVPDPSSEAPVKPRACSSILSRPAKCARCTAIALTERV